MQNMFNNFLAKLEFVNCYFKCTYYYCTTALDVLRLKVFFSIPLTYFFFNSSLAQGPIFHNRSMRSLLPNINHCHLIVLNGSFRTLLDSKDDNIADCRSHISFNKSFQNFLKMKRILTEIVLTPKKSTMKYNLT